MDSDTETKICFVIMPFGGWFDNYYERVYSPAIKEAGLIPHRADYSYRPSRVVNDIWLYTQKAILVLADLTGKNPNVLYELGLAHALGKPAILVSEDVDQVPFDLQGLRIIELNKNYPDWGEVLRYKILLAIRETLQAPQPEDLPLFLQAGQRGNRSQSKEIGLNYASDSSIEPVKQVPDGHRATPSSSPSEMMIQPVPENRAPAVTSRNWARVERYVEQSLKHGVPIDAIKSNLAEGGVSRSSIDSIVNDVSKDVSR